MNIKNLVIFLGLQRPYKIELKSRKHKKQDAAYWGLYSDNGKLAGHLIRVYLGNNLARSIDTLIAHELIHAWQEENGITEIHGPQFKKMALLVSHEFELDGIYMPDLDTE